MLPDASKTFRRRTAVRGRPMSPTQSALRHEPGEPPRRPMAFATRLFPGPEERCHDSCPGRGGRTSWRVMVAERVMSKHTQTGRDATEAEILEAERILSLTPVQQRGHPSAVPADHSKLSHINTYGSLAEFYLDQPFTSRKCGKREIWKARDQKWYYEE